MVIIETKLCRLRRMTAKIIPAKQISPIINDKKITEKSTIVNDLVISYIETESFIIFAPIAGDESSPPFRLLH